MSTQLRSPLTAAQCSGVDESHIEWLSERHGLIHETKLAWFAMQKAASSDGLELDLVSSFRSFDRQLIIWNGKFSGQRTVLDDNDQPVDLNPRSAYEKAIAILRFSALPGASRHHWGTDLDLYSARLQSEPLQLVASEYEAGGPQHPVSLWIQQHAAEFGFYQPYEFDLGGVAREPWHLSYAPVAEKIQHALSPVALAKLLSQSKIQGKACLLEHIEEIFERFVLRVSPLKE